MSSDMGREISLQTIGELEKYLEQNAYSFTALTIGKHCAPEGIVIEEQNGCFHYSYSERGEKGIIKSFDTECELVQYALSKLMDDEWATAHMVATTFDKDEILEAEKQLDKMGIAFRRNDMPNYQMGHAKYRIFVFGTDINFLSKFKKRFLHDS